MIETGSIKFACEHVAVELAPFAAFEDLNACRRKLLELRVLGVDVRGIGFGNLSARDAATRTFHVSGSGTGGKAELTLRDYARVTAYDFEENEVRCEGVAVASSESLTHAAVYEAEPAVGAVIHGHSRLLARRRDAAIPTTDAEVEYGTPAMAREVQRLFRETDVRERQVFLMGGHEDGFVTFGSTVEHALAVLIKHLRD
ncbi:hypothetical protein BH18VER1_BH18VER1_05620 [soil metagenome]